MATNAFQRRSEYLALEQDGPGINELWDLDCLEIDIEPGDLPNMELDSTPGSSGKNHRPGGTGSVKVNHMDVNMDNDREDVSAYNVSKSDVDNTFAEDLFSDLRTTTQTLNTYKMLEKLTQAMTANAGFAESEELRQVRESLTAEIKPIQERINETSRSSEHQPKVLFIYPKWSLRTVKSWFLENKNWSPETKPIQGENALIDLRHDRPAQPNIIAATAAVPGIQAVPQIQDADGNITTRGVCFQPPEPAYGDRGPYPEIITGAALERTLGNELRRERECFVMRDKNDPRSIDVVNTIKQFAKYSNSCGYTETHALSFLERLMCTIDSRGWEPYQHMTDANKVAESIINVHWVPGSLDQSAKLQEFIRPETENIYLTYNRLEQLLQTHYHWMPIEAQAKKASKEAAKAIVYLIHPALRIKITNRRAMARIRKEDPMENKSWDLKLIQLSEQGNPKFRQKGDLQLETKIEGIFVNFAALSIEKLIAAFSTTVSHKRKREPDLTPNIISKDKTVPEPQEKKVKHDAEASGRDTRRHLTPKHRNRSAESIDSSEGEPTESSRSRSTDSRPTRSDSRRNIRVGNLPRGISSSKNSGSVSPKNTRRWASPNNTRQFERKPEGDIKVYRKGDNLFNKKIRSRYKSQGENKYRKKSSYASMEPHKVPLPPDSMDEDEDETPAPKPKQKEVKPKITPPETGFEDMFPTEESDIAKLSPTPTYTRATSASPTRGRATTTSGSGYRSGRSVSRTKENRRSYSADMRKIMDMLNTRNYYYWKQKTCHNCGVKGHGTTVCPSIKCKKCGHFGRHPVDEICKLVQLKFARMLNMAVDTEDPSPQQPAKLNHAMLLSADESTQKMAAHNILSAINPQQLAQPYTQPPLVVAHPVAPPATTNTEPAVFKELLEALTAAAIQDTKN